MYWQVTERRSSSSATALNESERVFSVRVRDGNALSIGGQSGDISNATCDEVTQEQPENQGADDSHANTEHEEIPADELYENKTILQKLFVVSAGVLMNIVFAFILVIFCACAFHKLPTSSQNLFVDSFSQKARISPKS